jgi:hypothetical protein
MDRRTFLAAMGGGLVSGAGASRATPSARASDATIHTYVANVGETVGARALPQPGAVLRLTRAGTRHYDPHSVLVSNERGEPLGYLPSIHGRVLEPLVSAGLATEAQVETVKALPRPSLKIAIELRR